LAILLPTLGKVEPVSTEVHWVTANSRTMLDHLAPQSEWHAPSQLYAFLSSPITYLARTLYHVSLSLQRLPASTNQTGIRVVCLSDTHTQIPTDLPEGDLLIHAGDMGNVGDVVEIQRQIDWLRSLPYAQKVVIAGNHDVFLCPSSQPTLSPDQRSGKLNWDDIKYLQNGAVTLPFPNRGNRRLKIYGAPQVPIDGPEHAFRYDRSQDVWAETVPVDIDILVSHSPPRWHLDLPVGLGCSSLLKETWRVRPRLHVFGHIHAGAGVEHVPWDIRQAIYERICERCCEAKLGGVYIMSNWLDLWSLVVACVSVTAWSLLRRDASRGGSIMVNAALMSQETGRLEQRPRVVII